VSGMLIARGAMPCQTLRVRMTAALLRAVEDPTRDFRLLAVPDIRAAA
jgi:hypothetical protein